ncbi:licheninase [Obelidium mucronatum]|nr:licheninase [Obelidium mucronatum]
MHAVNVNLIAISMILLAARVYGQKQSFPPVGYALTWSDEFNGTGFVDSKNWNYDTWGNKNNNWQSTTPELQYYAPARLKNVNVTNGVLYITAYKEQNISSLPDWGGQSYTAGRIVTRGKKDFLYGFFEVRAKLSRGKGTHPAIWFRPTGSHGAWPNGGEIDVMEQIGQTPNSIFSNIHSPATVAASGSKGKPKEYKVLPSATNDWHNYQMLWTQDKLEFAVDGVVYNTYNKPTAAVTKENWPFTIPNFLILNVAVGGAWCGPPDATTFAQPVVMAIDYVRVYQVQQTAPPESTGGSSVVPNKEEGQPLFVKPFNRRQRKSCPLDPLLE